MKFRIEQITLNVLPMRTRFPFRYGIASMGALPHLFVSVDLVIGDQAIRGIASEGLPPKWFTKDPDTLFEQDLAEMLAVIQNASRIARHAATQDTDYFPWWQNLYQEQAQWASVKECPHLLANLGVSLMERAVLHGLCSAAGCGIHALLARADNPLRIDLGSLHPELKDIAVSDVVAASPTPHTFVRHTVGLGDPLDANDGEGINDGLPYTLDESIRNYGLRYFKIKVSGDPKADLLRLRKITDVISRNCGQDFHATLDGNENFQAMDSFRQFYEELSSDKNLAPLFVRLLMIEQPLHRSVALADEVAAPLQSWADGPGMIIDESDATLQSLPRALDLGYIGTSHKNCKGIIKSLANAALLKARQATSTRPLILSAEDLASVGPISMLQDLAVGAALGITHVERNGHHYFRGLAAFPQEVQDQALRTHPDLYHRHPEGFATLTITNGQLDLTTINTTPMGSGTPLDPSQFSTLKEWIYAGGLSQQ
ncbi:MAG: hypothetical protein KDK97_23755 [Verrucomicrobiales bacterium]|nr:hypothetical protein [Verrucomicrobiales bacterium]MCP5558018.1 hypothetical protein [Verrucomicrobiaceae bacterium]